MQKNKQLIDNGDAIVGIELGSTRIKAVLITESGETLATGYADWENRFIDSIWTYHLDEVWDNLQAAYASLQANVTQKYGTHITQLKAMGISAMMHGYLPFDKAGNQLSPFKTWRNNITLPASQILTRLFDYPVPQRWSVAHLYQCILDKEPHIADIDYLTTLSGYVHWQLTGEKVLGIGDASGMFPIDTNTLSYDKTLLSKFGQVITDYQVEWKLENLLPTVLVAGQNAGKLTEKGARLLDPKGLLKAGVPLCPPEGDAGTGMIATNSIKENTGNISAGTSAFTMVVLDKPLSRSYAELDLVTTPAGKLVAMAHANNCSTDINNWINLFNETLQTFGVNIDTDELYNKLFLKALQGDPDCGGLLSYGFYSGEHNVKLTKGCPLFLHPTNAKFSLANFIRVHLYSAFGAMKIGMDILQQQENINITHILGHGGIFKTEQVAQSILAAALNTPVATMDTASDGGAWGIALLANYLSKKDQYRLETYLDQEIFNQTKITLTQPDPAVAKGYQQFMENYKKGIDVVQAALKADISA
ncbi:FGGY-family carbohydrate kinase [Pasteurella skyensis]|uniref:xylulokinase n=1 Tax=Phocoenobacter skyensis TaxID=97481 RepID=UPI00274CD5AC|nr:FGGY-family carbohydrate kinase [Pasteurella skyensis]MDP8170377.1 FGGY-family carbohydrate kinase [Pasteurella skyensis]MDP8176597.1 FGGY-family carbohydrate kinase [Pasteurella skyensis]MDP8198890.1 FGGY-family carbohydrate kinase [Pasteurella skyensis]